MTDNVVLLLKVENFAQETEQIAVHLLMKIVNRSNNGGALHITMCV